MPSLASMPLHRASARQRHYVPLLATAIVGAAALTMITYLLWPTWRAGTLDGPEQLPITVGGMLFDVPPKAIRIKLQRRTGAQDRIDLAFTYPGLMPPEPQPHVTADTVEKTPVVIDRLLLSIATHGDELAPEQRVRTIYPRYLDPDATSEGGLTAQAFLHTSPYRGEDLFTATEPAFVARCTRDDLTPGICLSERRLGSVDLTFRFPRAWLPQWRNLASAMDRLVVALRHG